MSTDCVRKVQKSGPVLIEMRLDCRVLRRQSGLCSGPARLLLSGSSESVVPGIFSSMMSMTHQAQWHVK